MVSGGRRPRQNPRKAAAVTGMPGEGGSMARPVLQELRHLLGPSRLEEEVNLNSTRELCAEIHEH